jgi:Uma2 family endonuclease
MRAAMIHEELLEDRRRKGLDKRDEVWAGVLHMVPPPEIPHNTIHRDLFLVLNRIATRLGLQARFECGLFNPRVKGDKDFRVPDLVVASPHVTSKRGVEGKATLVVEVLSPGDESRAKLPFYAKVGVREVWLVDPETRTVEVLVLRDLRLVPARPRDGVIRSPAMEVELSTVKGKLLIRDADHVDEL